MSVLAMLDNLIKRAVLKTFKVPEKLVIRDIRDFLGLHDVESLCEMRRTKFLIKTRTLTHAILQSLTGQLNSTQLDEHLWTQVLNTSMSTSI